MLKVISGFRRDINMTRILFFFALIGKFKCYSTNAPPSTKAPMDKELILLRHGVTELNEYLKENPWGPGFKDPALWDTKLSSGFENIHINTLYKTLIILYFIQPGLSMQNQSTIC
jgi:hypothetical protein